MKNTNFTLHFILGQLNSSAGSVGGGWKKKKALLVLVQRHYHGEGSLSRRSDLEGRCGGARGNMAAARDEGVLR